jgi:autotransporter-associated beta strand protein
VTNTAAKTIDLVVSFITQTAWTGATNSNWDTVTTNWTSAGVPVAYTQLASVLFGDTASNSTVNLAATMTPSSVLISNNVLSYQFAGAGGIGGAMNLTKAGTNSVSLGTANTFSGNVTITGGALVISNAAALGSTANPVYVTNGGTLDIDANALNLEPVIVSGAGVNGVGALINSSATQQNNAYRNVTMTGDTTIGGIGGVGLRTMADSDPGLVANGHNLTKVGPSQFNLNGGTTVAGLTNEWGTDIGNIDIQQGAISFERRVTLGLTNNTITVEAGAMIQLFSLNQTLTPPINKVVMTNATFQGNGASANDVNTFDGPLVLNGNTNLIDTTGSTFLSLNGPIAGMGGAIFNGAITLSGTNTFTGPTVVSNSTLTLASGATLSGSTSITVQSNATLDVSAIAPWTLGAGQTLGGYGTVNGSVVASGTVAPGTAMGTLTFNNDLTLAGTTVLVLDKDVASQTNDLLAVAGTLTYGGTLTVVTAGSTPLVVGDSFQLFSFGSAPGGSFSATNLPAGFTWDASQLAVTGTIKVTGIASRPHPRFVSVKVSGGSLILSGTNAVGSYTLYSTTNLAVPNWVPVFTNGFSGSFSFTNTLNGAQKFYLLQ